MGKTQGGPAQSRRPKELLVALAVTLVWVITVSWGLLFPSTVSLAYLAMVGLTTLLAALTWALLLLAVRQQGAVRWTLAQLQALAPEEFEEWASARFEEIGYEVKVASAFGEHGVDLVAEKPGEFAVIQCHRYKDPSIDESVLHSVLDAMRDFGAQRAYLVTTGKLTEPAREWAEGQPITVWDGAYLSRLGQQAAPSTLANGRATGTAAAGSGGAADDEATETQPGNSVPAIAGFTLSAPEDGVAEPEETSPPPGELPAEVPAIAGLAVADLEQDAFADDGAPKPDNSALVITGLAEPQPEQDDEGEVMAGLPPAEAEEGSVPAISGWLLPGLQSDAEGKDDYPMSKLLDDTEIHAEDMPDEEV